MPLFAPNSSATALQTLLTKALNGSAVGVEVIQNPNAGTLTYRLMTNRTAFFNDLTLADVSAQLIVLPADSSSSSSMADSSGSSSNGAATDDSSYTCLKLVPVARNVSFTNADGSISNITVYDEVWQNVTRSTSTDSSSSSSSNSSDGGSSNTTSGGDTTSNNSSSSSDPSASPAADQSPAVEQSPAPDGVFVDHLAGISIEVLPAMGPPPIGGKPQGAWQLLLEGQDQVREVLSVCFWVFRALSSMRYCVNMLCWLLVKHACLDYLISWSVMVAADDGPSSSV